LLYLICQVDLFRDTKITEFEKPCSMQRWS